MAKGEAMSDYPAWGDNDFEHLLIAYLKRISISLEKMENKMPTPQGDITSTETWSETPVEEAVEEELPEEEADQA
jgi:hypothetical protein